jgi:hypothetical protein
MTTSKSETYTETYAEALQRLANERASGLLTSAHAGGIAVLLRDGRTAMIGPHDGPPPLDDDPISRATAVEELVAQLVSGIKAGASSWFFLDGDGGTEHAMIEVPAGLPAEVARRTMSEVETRAHPATAPNAPTTADKAMPVAAEMSELYDSHNEPDLWVMNGEPGAILGATVSPSPLTAKATRTSEEVASEEVASEEVASEEVASEEVASEEVASEEVADTSWLDELVPAPTRGPSGNPEPKAEPLPVTTSDTTASDDSAGGTSELEGLRGSPETVNVPTFPAANEPVAGSDSPPGDTQTTTAQRPRPRPEDVSEFLRELSRLALDDGS